MDKMDAYELAYKNGYKAGYAATREQNKSKEYKLLDGRTAIFLHNDDGIGTIPVELMDKLMDEINKLTAERDEAIKDLYGHCDVCKHYKREYECCEFWFDCDFSHWEWRGAK